MLRHVARRSLFYVPGDSTKKVTKALGLTADFLVLDCEDGVAANRKSEARENCGRVIGEGISNARELAVRVNAVSSCEFHEDMLFFFRDGRRPPKSILLPKVDSVADIDTFVSAMGEKPKDIQLTIYTESPEGLLNLRDICHHTRDVHSSRVSLNGVVFGSDDYCAAVGCARSPNGEELMYARQKLVTVAKAAGLHATDMVHIDIRNLESLKETSEAGARLGFTGRQIIHPTHLDIVHAAYSPTDDRVEWATKLTSAFAESQARGDGAFIFRGVMVDRPLLLQAHNVLAAAGKVTS